MTALSATGRAALAYAARFAWFVLPIRPGSKDPYARFVRHGFLDATRDPEQISRWWQADPRAPVAIACAASGLVVLDIDPRSGGDDAFADLEKRLGRLPDTPRVITAGGGQHFYFRDTVGAYRGKAAPGIDIKNAGYVLAPPSVHPNGRVYVWDVGAHVTESPLAELPDAWLDHVTENAVDRNVLPSSGVDAGQSWLGHAFGAMGWLGPAFADGRRMARCPWLAEHTDGRGDCRDSSTVVFPHSADRTLGGFRCAHGHCEGRGWREVIDVLPSKAKWAADEAMRAERNRLAYARLDALRRVG